MSTTNGKHVMFAISKMHGFGAERIAALLTNQMCDAGVDMEVMVTNAPRKDVFSSILYADIPIQSLQDMLPSESKTKKLLYKLLGIYARGGCWLYERKGEQAPLHFSYASFNWLYHREIATLRSYFIKHPEMTVIAFLHPTIPIVLLAARGLPNKIIISERVDAARAMRKRYGGSFAQKYYARADVAVFQTEDAKKAYPDTIQNKQIIINPLTEGLPMPYHGARDKRIVTYGRIAQEKNLPLLLDAFAIVHEQMPEYTLELYSDLESDSAKQLMPELEAQLHRLAIADAVVFRPFCSNVHERILNAAMYVNSSDLEGISNSMLEAMAIGLPVVCTDCPAGGAKQTIQNGENGMLVPMNDKAALSEAMLKVIHDGELSNRLSQNGAKLRSELELKKIAAKWIALL